MTTRSYSMLVAAAIALGLAPALAAPVSRNPGGYGPIRLGMAEADAVKLFPSVAHDISKLTMDALSSYDPATLSKMAVAVPWEESYVGRLDPNTKVQFGVHDGRVITVFLRTSSGDPAATCRAAFAAEVRRNEAEFGPLQLTGDQNDPAASITADGDFSGWALDLNGTEMEDGKCSLTTDYTSDTDKTVEEAWRDGMRPKG